MTPGRTQLLCGATCQSMVVVVGSRSEQGTCRQELSIEMLLDGRATLAVGLAPGELNHLVPLGTFVPGHIPVTFS